MQNAVKMHNHLQTVLDNCILIQEEPEYVGLLDGCKQSQEFKDITMALWDTWRSYPNWSPSKKMKYLVRTLFRFVVVGDVEGREWMLKNVLQLKKRGRPRKLKTTRVKEATAMMQKLLSHDAV